MRLFVISILALVDVVFQIQAFFYLSVVPQQPIPLLNVLRQLQPVSRVEILQKHQLELPSHHLSHSLNLF
jgi:hypothetical protein